MHNRLQPVAVLVGFLVLSGCATGPTRSLAGRFVRPGEPAMDYGGPRVAPAESLSDYMTKLRHLSARPARQGTFGATVESTDPGLAKALLEESLVPDAVSHLRVAQQYRRLGLLDSAYARLNRAVLKNPRLAEAHEALARIWRDWGLPDQGLGSAYRAIYHDPYSASARNTLGTLFDALGRREEARRAYEQAVVLDPTASWAFNNLCYAEFLSGRFAQARARCTEALRLAPAMPAAHNNLALVHAASGNLEAARSEFLAAGDLASAAYNFGIVHLAERDYVAAAAAFEEAIKARATFTAAKARAHAARARVVTGIQ